MALGSKGSQVFCMFLLPNIWNSRAGNNRFFFISQMLCQGKNIALLSAFLALVLGGFRVEIKMPLAAIAALIAGIKNALGYEFAVALLERYAFSLQVFFYRYCG
jgi:hypothetical protein